MNSENLALRKLFSVEYLVIEESMEPSVEIKENFWIENLLK